MDKIDLTNIRQLLGIYNPWSIKQVKPDIKNKTYHIFIEANEGKQNNRLFGIIDTHKKQDQSLSIKGSWSYISIGRYQCVIHAQIPKSSFDMSVAINSDILYLPPFLGHPSRSYSNYVRQQVVLQNNRGDDINSICHALKISKEKINQILTDTNNATNKIQSLSFLPTEIDPIWEDVISERKEIKSNFLPFKLFLTKQKNIARKQTDILENNIVANLRKFFMVNIDNLEEEVNQLCDNYSNSKKAKSATQRSQQKLVLPSIKNPLWIDLLSNKLNLHSQSVPLNLLISRQRLAFINAKKPDEKIKAIEIIRNYIKVNCRRLKSELVLLNRAMEIKKSNRISLPKPDHEIWQNILSDSDYIPSNNMAYKLLLASLKVQLTNNNDTQVKIAAAKRIRDFLEQNKRAMREELSMLLQQSRAV